MVVYLVCMHAGGYLLFVMILPPSTAAKKILPYKIPVL